MAKKRAEVAAAKNIVIVGAGAVGVGNIIRVSLMSELFGEINMVNPNANVTIIQGANLPLNSAYTDSFRQKVKKEVENRGGKFMLNEKANLTSTDTKAVKLQSGKTLTADIVVLSPTTFTDI
jgi:NADH dehydrogenase FAD-containing subunit